MKYWRTTNPVRKESFRMAKQKSPHTQTEQNVVPERTDFETVDGRTEADANIYDNMEGAETGTDRSPRKVPRRVPRHNTEPESVAHEGSVTARTPKRPAQGITERPDEESRRQQKVVNDRPDAKAGLNRSKQGLKQNVLRLFLTELIRFRV
jgi:hypothetical protein